MLVTLDTFHEDRLPLHDEAPWNIESMVVTLDMFHEERLELNDSAPKNIYLMAVIFETSHLERSALNCLTASPTPALPPQNNQPMLVTSDMFQILM